MLSFLEIIYSGAVLVPHSLTLASQHLKLKKPLTEKLKFKHLWNFFALWNLLLFVCVRIRKIQGPSQKIVTNDNDIIIV